MNNNNKYLAASSGKILLFAKSDKLSFGQGFEALLGVMRCCRCCRCCLIVSYY